MHEVINFSCSQASGHLITQLYNVQESHLPYSRNKVLTHANDVFLQPRKVNGKSNYYPRSINVEFQGGYGYLGKHAFREPEDILKTYNDAHHIIVKKEDRHVKNEYQTNLDKGLPTRASLLSTENTTFWTDYNKLIYRPESLVSLATFSHPDGAHKNFPRLKFNAFNVGEEEFKLAADEIDDCFRKNLESSDQIQGVSFFSECDGAWAGFTNEMMVFLRDEYFGNGVSSKYNLWVYGLMKQRENPKNIESLLTRIRATVDFAANSTLFFPLAAPKSPESILSTGYDADKLWHTGAVQSLFVNSLWGLNCQVERPISMATIENNLLRGNSNRNVVDKIVIRPEYPKVPDQGYGIVSDVNTMDMYLNAGQNQGGNTRNSHDIGNDQTGFGNNNTGFGNDNTGSGNANSNSKGKDDLHLGLSKVSADHVYSRGIISKTSPDSGVADSITDTYVNPYIEEITKIDSFPSILENDKFSARFSQTGALKPLLKQYRDIVQRVRLPQHVEILGDRSEIVESISSLMEEYTQGFSDESDYDD